MSFTEEEDALPRKHKGLKLTLLVLSIALLVPAGFLVWMRLHPAPPTTAPEQSPADSKTAPPPANPPTRRRPDPDMAGGTLQVQAKTMDQPNPPVIEEENVPVPGIYVESPRLRPVPFRLQAIFSSARPSAIINGKTVYVNGRIGDFRVVSITAHSVILVSETQTNELILK